MTATGYDYVIVGAGSAGCVLANRLSANPQTRVLLVESGPDDTSPLIRMPRGIGRLLNPGNPHVWAYDVSPGGNGPNEPWLKGRAIGGSSSVNGMVYIRGAPRDYDGWAAGGCTGWGWDEIGRCFVALEDHELGAAKWRGVGGPVHVSVHRSGNPLCEAVLTAGQQLGVNRVPDINDVDAVRDGGLGYQTRNIDHGRRISSAYAFLRPARSRPNLTVMPRTDVLRIEIENHVVTGLTLRNASGTSFVPAREVILSAGAVQSPKLLQLSGIGPAQVLRAAGIEVIVDAPQVGQNLREHRYLQTVYRVTGGSMNQNYAGLGLLKSVLQYGLLSRGALTHAAHEVGGFVKTRPGLDHADAQIGVSLYSLHYGPKGIEPDPYPGVTILGYFTNPESQGEVRINSADPDALPTINANHFATEIDRISAVSLFRWLRALGQQPALKPWIVAEQGVGATIKSDDDILHNALALGGTSYHIAGTCRMGADADSVVDPQLRVRGVTGLRVADTSIMPTLVSGNTNAPAMVVGMRAAEFILADARS